MIYQAISMIILPFLIFFFYNIGIFQKRWSFISIKSYIYFSISINNVIIDYIS